MKKLYVRFILWLMRPVLDEAKKEATKATSALVDKLQRAARLGNGPNKELHDAIAAGNRRLQEALRASR